MNRILAIGLGLVCGVAGSLEASSKRVPAEKVLPDTKMAAEMTARAEVINPNAGPCVAGDVGFDFSLDFLYWTRNTSFPFMADGIGLSEVGSTITDINVPSTGTVYYPDFSFDPGFRIGASLDFAYDGWQLEAIYTWFHSSASKNFTPNPNNGFSQADSFLQILPTAQSFFSALAKEKFTLNMGRLQLSRDFYTSPRMALRPNIGFVSTYVPLQYEATYDFLEFPDSTPHRINYHKDRMSALGYGVSVGLDSSFYFTKEWSVVANYNFSPIWARYKIKTKEVSTNLTAGGQITNLWIKDVVNNMQLTHDLFLGFMWRRYFDGNNYLLNVHAGWEMLTGLIEFTHANQGFLHFQALDIQGFTAGTKLDF